MTWTTWRAHFESQRGRDLPTVTADGVPEHARAHLARSLAVFALGEAGEGKIAHEIERFEPPTIDEDWRASVRLWIREEGRHGRILGLGVRALGGHPATTNWTNDLLVLGRRLLGVRLKLLVILCAEVVGITFYGILASKMPHGSSLRSALEAIVVEEEQHLRFHARFFERETQTLLRWWLFVLMWTVVGAAAGAAVALDHRHTLSALGCRGALRTFARGLVDAANRVRGDHPPRPWWAYVVVPSVFTVALASTMATMGTLSPVFVPFVGADKVAHFLLYGSVAMGAVGWAGAARARLVVGVLSALSVVDELAQGLSPTRGSDVFDLVASVSGIVIFGWVAWRALRGAREVSQVCTGGGRRADRRTAGQGHGLPRRSYDWLRSSLTPDYSRCDHSTTGDTSSFTQQIPRDSE